MLQKIRDNTQGMASKIFVYFIIGIFSLWGIDTIVGTIFTSNSTLTVNDTEITEAEIESLTQQKSQEYFRNLGENADLSGFDERQFREAAVNELIQRELLNQSAENSGMVISSASLDRRIALTQDFQIDGVFNAERANLLLQSMGYSAAGYRALLASETLLNQQLAAFSSTGFATRAELERLSALTHQKRSFRYFTLGLNQDSDITITDEAINAYYAENPDAFMQEELVKVEYLELNKNAMLGEISVTEEQIRTAYDEEVAAYQAQTERRASHILFEAGTEAEFATALAAAEAARARLDAGESFEALAAELSDDVSSAQDGGDVGYTTGDNFVENFEAALRVLAVDEVSEPVRTEFGVHLIKLTSISETEIDPYEFRRDALELDLKNAGVTTLFISRSEELSNLAFESFDLDDPAMQMGLEKQVTDWFGRVGGAGIAGNSVVSAAAFSPEVLEEGLNSDLLQVDSDRSVVIHILDHQLADMKPLEAVRGEIEVLLQIQAMQDQAKSLGETFVSSLESGGNIDSLLEVQNLSWTQVDAVERSVPTVNPQITDKIFSLQRPAKGATVAGGMQLTTGEFVVFELQSVTDGTAEDFNDGEEQNMRNFISQQGAANDFAGFMEGLEARAKIKGKEKYLNSIDPLF